MGLSASQTRFLGLTARKSNVEYQGQQINQARTALANQSSELFTQMMNLKAPIAPSTYKYVIDPATNPNIDWTKENAYPLSKENMKNFAVYYAGNQPQFSDFNIPEYTYVDDGEFKGYCSVSTDENGVKHYGSRTIDENGNIVYQKEYYDKENIPGTYFTRETGKYASGNSVSYLAINVPEDANYTYDAKTGMFKAKEGVTDAELPAYIQAFNYAAGLYSTYSKPDKIAIYAPDADLETLKDENAANDAQAVSYTQSATVNQNLAQYNQALAQYDVDQKEYEEALDEINAKTEDIHQADKKLELQLKQLDTEQEAIQTEYDAVKKVIEKNIENTFKTFA